MPVLITLNGFTIVATEIVRTPVCDDSGTLLYWEFMVRGHELKTEGDACSVS